ncbi:hypothetical protein Q5752_003632 [Cryptotrichosporon argae]
MENADLRCDNERLQRQNALLGHELRNSAPPGDAAVEVGILRAQLADAHCKRRAAEMERDSAQRELKRVRLGSTDNAPTRAQGAVGHRAAGGGMRLTTPETGARGGQQGNRQASRHHE